MNSLFGHFYWCQSILVRVLG